MFSPILVVDIGMHVIKINWLFIESYYGIAKLNAFIHI